MRIIPTPRDQKAIISLKLFDLGYPPSHVRHDKLLLRLDTQRRLMLSAGLGEVPMQDLAERLALRVRLVRLQDEDLDDCRVNRRFEVFRHCE